MSIFIGIPSYCDPVLGFTMAQAYEKAKYPDDLYFGVVDQSPLHTPSLIPAHIPPAQIASIRVDASQSRGCCWARSLVGTLYNDQDWFLQLDSHMMFEQDWDVFLCAKADACMALSDHHCVISSYPENFRFVDGKPVSMAKQPRLLANVVHADSQFGERYPVLNFAAISLEGAAAVEGFHIAGGCLFAPGDYAQVVPYDPYMYFQGEEQSMSLRLYTHGWSIYHVRGIPIHHLYNNEDSGVQRDLHWDKKDGDIATVNAKPRWASLDRRSKRRLRTLLWGDATELGAFGLGHEKTLQEYAHDTGIDYTQRSIAPRAYAGPWSVPKAKPPTTGL
jgi:hypothetical protein